VCHDNDDSVGSHPSSAPAVRLRVAKLASKALAFLLLATPLAVAAQQPAKTARIGLLSPFSRSDTALWHQAFRQGLHDLGWVEGGNLSIEYRYADPVSQGLAASLARPGGNITGLSQIGVGLTGKRLELLKEFVPTLSRLAVLWNPPQVGSVLGWKEIQLPAQKLGIQLHSLEVRNAGDFAKAVADATRARAGALFVMPAPLFVTNLRGIADLAAKSRLPSIFHVREFADAGGLMAYGPDRSHLFRRAATYVDKILKGVKPGDLPIEQPTKFELVINVKTAKALGLKIPPSLLLQANQVIE